MSTARHAVVIAFLLAASSAATAQVEVAPPPHPTLDEVVKEYLRLELPLPPKDAVLVRIDTLIDFDLSGLEEEKRRDWEENRYLLAFRTADPARPNKPIYLATGFGSVGLEPYDKPVFGGVTELRPDPRMLDRGETTLNEIGQLAVFYKLRGEHELAKRLYAMAMSGTDGPLNLSENFRVFVWYELRDRLTERNSDRRAILKGLKRIADGFESEEEGQAVGTGLIAALEATVGFKRTAKPGTVEALIDDLTEHYVPTLLQFDEARTDAYWKLVDMGFDAVPALIEHVRDDRLSRACDGGAFNNSRVYNLTVGHLCSDILYELSARTIEGGYWPLRGDRYDPAEVRKWFEKAKKIGEEKWLLDHAIPTDGGGPMTNHYGRPEPRIVRIIGVKYPKHLVRIHRKTLKEFGGHYEAIAASKLPREEKIALLKDGGDDAMFALADADIDEYRKSLLAALRDLDEKKRAERYIYSSIALHLARAGDPECWTAYASAVRRSSHDTRLWTLAGDPRRFGGTLWGDKYRTERIRFLSSFLDDRTAERNKDRWFDRVEVRDYAACQLAGMLGYRVIRTHDRRIVPDAKNGPLTRLLFRARMAQAASAELERLRTP
jgi:hypothetical protein